MTLQKRKLMLFASLLTFVLLFFAFNHSITAYAEETGVSGQPTIEQSGYTADTETAAADLVDEKTDDAIQVEEEHEEVIPADKVEKEEQSANTNEETKPKDDQTSQSDVNRGSPGTTEVRTVAKVARAMARDASEDASKNASEKTNIQVTEFKITNSQNHELGSYAYNETMKLSMTWDASAYGNTLKEGDYFNITLPDNMKFPTNSSATNFDIYDPTGQHVVANAVVSPGANGGGTVKVTFTDYVENRENIKGTVNLQSRFTKTVYDEENQYIFIVGEHTYTQTIKVDGPIGLDNELLGKWGQAIDGVDDQVDWKVRINHRKSDLKNVIITDSLSEDSGNLGDMQYIPESFEFWRVIYHEYGGLQQKLEQIDLAGRITFTDNNTKFIIDLSDLDLGNDQYRLEYRTTYTPGTRLRNRVTVQTDDETKTQSMSFKDASSSGTGSGDLNSKIKITKVAADDGTVVLAGAVFEVTRPNGTTFMLTTGADGTVTSELLSQGTYTVKEVTAPIGYELNGEEFTLEVTPTGGALQTVTNAPIRINVTATKKWVGPVKDSVTVRLLADGAEVQSQVLNEANGWTYTFTGLRKYSVDGSEIAYSVIEDAVENYNSAVDGDADTGFTITNTNTETTAVNVMKNWIGPKTDSVMVRLLADGTEVQSQALNEANGWAYTFANLTKYNADGTEIVYTVSEDAVANYDTAVNGNAGTGFTITNTNTETTAVNVVKNWIGPKTDSVMVRLLADGTEILSQALNEANGWAYTFANLTKYNADGSAIVYTVTEDAVANYESDIEASEDGYVITNTITGKVSIPVTKVWKGEALDQVTIRLYADGKEVATCVLNAANGWTYTFADFDKYSNGNAITYTIQEDATAGYTTEITGSVEEGFTVTNTKEETPKEETPEEPSEPEKPKDPITPVSVETTPNTGTNTNTMMWIGMMFASVCLAGAMLLVSRKRQEQ